jgi:uncharacterized protein with ParB-like and HNH nuclease domain
MSHEVETFNVKSLFTTDQYRIPIYQRNYAWGKKEISQLIQDILDFVPEQKNYYIGTLVVYRQQKEEDLYFDTIDGQQRLTTLSILLSVLRKEFGQADWFRSKILQFESRPLSQNAMDFAFNGYFSGNKEYHSAIKEAYDHIHQELPVKLRETDVDIEFFVEFLSEKVTILRVEVPHDTDLNHYFEIMNNRGEQLEKHEVVKSLLLDALYDEDDENNGRLQELFHIVWDAVQQMERYVQFGFETTLRKRLFGKDWTWLQPSDSEELMNSYFEYKQNAAADEEYLMTIDEILEVAPIKNPENSSEQFDRFTSPVNFQNFLLHILKIQTEEDEVKLDDKRLIDFFKDQLRKRSSKAGRAFVIDLMYNLLRGKWNLDAYVIKRQFLANKEGWSVLMLVSNDGKKGYYVNSFGDDDEDENDYIVMLLSMFHVSTPTMIYKHWLNAVLHYLMSTEEVEYDDYKSYLESIAKDLICFRFLNEDEGNKLDYHTLIYERAKIQKRYPAIAYDNALLSYRTIENNLLFNFLDYVIWQGSDWVDVGDFEFSFRSSVEHYYPQNPIGGKKLDDEEALHSFGNLCLISHQKNSKLNHHLPSAKKNYYKKLNKDGQLAYDSLKQKIMMSAYDADEWDEESIYDHHRKMIDLMNKFIQNK